MKQLSLAVVDVDADLAAPLVRKLQAACRNVRLTNTGYFIRGRRRDDWPGYDWRRYYAKLLDRLFPSGWVYRGGHHLAVHASPPAQPRLCRPAPGAEAGRRLFAIVEQQPTSSRAL